MLAQISRVCSWSHFNDVCASWVFLPSEHESSAPTGDVAASRSIYVCRAVVHLVVRPLPSHLPRLLSDFIVSHLCDRYPLAWFLRTTHGCAVVNKNKFLATSITHAHKDGLKKRKHVRLHPTFTSHDSQGLLQLTPVPVLECRCWDTCQTEKDFPSAHTHEDTLSLTFDWAGWLLLVDIK